MKKLNILAIFLWLFVGVYGIFYNITYIDEAKYLIKGWLITTGQVGYYTTPEFFYQHLPGGLLWYGLGQKIFGPNLLAARVQSFLIGLLILFFTYRLARLIQPGVQRLILPILALSPVAILYYSSAVPQSLAALILVLAFYFWFKNKLTLTTICFTLAFIIRENFLFTLIFYLIWPKRQRLKQLLTALFILVIFFAPGWPGVLNVFKNFPGISSLLPVSAAEKTILALNWQQQNHVPILYWQAVKEFLIIYLPLWFVLFLKTKKDSSPDRKFRFLVFITSFNFLAHAWSAFNLSPRAITPYLAYIYPQLAVIAAVRTKIKPGLLTVFILLSPLTLLSSSLFQPPSRPTLKILSEAASDLKPLIAGKNKIVWLGEPMALYLAGKISYYPLINSINFYKPSQDTPTIKALGFWNDEIMNQWLNSAELTAVDSNRRQFINLGPEWQAFPPPNHVWPKQMNFYFKSSSTL